jgi:hypothetical protein
MAKRPQFTIPGTQFEKPPKPNWIGPVLFLLFVIATLAASVWLFRQSPTLKPLECDTSSGMGSLTSWGACHEAE